MLYVIKNLYRRQPAHDLHRQDALALSMHAWLDTAADWRRLEATLIVRNRRNRQERH